MTLKITIDVNHGVTSLWCTINFFCQIGPGPVSYLWLIVPILLFPKLILDEISVVHYHVAKLRANIALGFTPRRAV